MPTRLKNQAEEIDLDEGEESSLDTVWEEILSGSIKLSAVEDAFDMLLDSSSLHLPKPDDCSQMFFKIQRDGYDEYYRKPDKIIQLPDIRQDDDFSCGAMDAMACGKLRGVGPDEKEEWIDALHTTEADSTEPGEIVTYLAELGLDVHLYEHMTLDDLRIAFSEGNPVICMVREYDTDTAAKASRKYGHYLTVVGVDIPVGYVIVFDSSADNVLDNEDSANAPGLNMVTEQEFLSRWHDREYEQLGIVVGKLRE